MSDRDSSVNGDKSKVIGLAGLSSIVKGAKVTGRKVSHRAEGYKHASDIKDEGKKPLRKEAAPDSSTSATVVKLDPAKPLRKEKKK